MLRGDEDEAASAQARVLWLQREQVLTGSRTLLSVC